MRVIETELSPAVLALLEASGLPAADLRAGRPATFLAAVIDCDLLGCVGYELSEGVALLRSLAVQPTARGDGVGRQLVAEAEQHAKDSGAKEVFLLTTTAAAFFEQLGFKRVARDAAPAFIAGLPNSPGYAPGQLF